MTATLIIVPTFNEAENIERFVGDLRRCAPDADILVVDDDSPDGTGGLATRLAEADPSVNVLHRAAKEGLGVAYRAGFAWGLARDQYDRFVEMDADGSHNPAELRRLPHHQRHTHRPDARA